MASTRRPRIQICCSARIAPGRRESFDQAHERHAGLAAQPVEVPLALTEGQGPEIDAILVQQVVNHENQLRLLGPARAHFGVELAKVGLATGIDEAELAIEDGRARRQPLEGLGHQGQALGVFGPAF